MNLERLPRSPVSRKAPRPECREAGNVLFYIFIAIAILGLLTYAISQTGEQQSSFGDLEQRNEEISRLQDYVAALGGVVNHMVAMTSIPAPFLISTHRTGRSIPRPTSRRSSILWRRRQLHVERGHGCQQHPRLEQRGHCRRGPHRRRQRCGSDITFTAVISSAEFCQKINQGCIIRRPCP